MRKILFIFSSVLTFSFIFTSCEKEEDTEDETVIQKCEETGETNSVKIVDGSVVLNLRVEEEEETPYALVKVFLFMDSQYSGQNIYHVYKNEEVAANLLDEVKREYSVIPEFESALLFGNQVIIRMKSSYQFQLYENFSPLQLKSHLEDIYFQ